MRTVLWTGSRGWQDVDSIIATVLSLKRPFRSIVGDARGWDSLVWEILAKHGLPRLRFDAQWPVHGKRAGVVRNLVMRDVLQRIDSQGFVIAGWDGESRGTKIMIDMAEEVGIPVWRVAYVLNLNGG